MREQIRDKGRLEHILKATDFILRHTKGITFEEFDADELRYFAVIKNLEIIGEASYKLTKEFIAAHPEIKWKLIIGLRHVLVHGYYQIENILAWEIVQKDLVPLQKQIKEIYENME